MPKLQVLADRLMHILPADGSQMPNDEARTLLGRAVEAPIEGETYFSVIALLERNGEILRGRGRGGAVRRAQPQTAAGTDTAATAQGKRAYAVAAALSGGAVLAAVGPSRRCLPGGDRYLEGRRSGWSVASVRFHRHCHRAACGARGSEVELFTFRTQSGGLGKRGRGARSRCADARLPLRYLVWHVPDRDRVKARLPRRRAGVPTDGRWADPVQ